MRSGAVDLIFGALRLPPPFDDVREEALFDDPYCVVCRRDHPLVRTLRPKRADLRKYNWIFPTAGLPRRVVLDAFIARWKLSSHIQLETNAPGSITSALAASNRISLLPRAYALVEDQSGSLAVLDVEVPHDRRMVGISSRLDWLPTTHQLEFVSLLRETSKRLDGMHAKGARSRRSRAGKKKIGAKTIVPGEQSV
jgi:DNA-binding transcriptional LysR family regulator